MVSPGSRAVVSSSPEEVGTKIYSQSSTRQITFVFTTTPPSEICSQTDLSTAREKVFPLAEQLTGHQDQPSRLAKFEPTHEQHPSPEPSLSLSSAPSPSSSSSPSRSPSPHPRPRPRPRPRPHLTLTSPPQSSHSTLKKHGTTKQTWQLHPPTQSSPPSPPTTGQTTQSIHGWPHFLNSSPNSHDHAAWRTRCSN